MIKLMKPLRLAFGLLALCACSAFAQNAASVPASSPETNWSIKVTTDPITDLRQGSARLRAQSGGQWLSLICNGLAEPTLSLQYSADKFLGSSAGVALVRINKGPVLPAAGWEFQGRIAFTTDDGWIANFAQSLGNGDAEIIVRAIDFQGQPHDGVFQSKNGAEAFRQMAEICLPVAQPAKRK